MILRKGAVIKKLRPEFPLDYILEHFQNNKKFKRLISDRTASNGNVLNNPVAFGLQKMFHNYMYHEVVR